MPIVFNEEHFENSPSVNGIIYYKYRKSKYSELPKRGILLGREEAIKHLEELIIERQFKSLFETYERKSDKILNLEDIECLQQKEQLNLIL